MHPETRQLAEALGELYGQNDLTLFPRATLKILSRLIPSVSVSFNEVNFQTQAVHFLFEPEAMAEIVRKVEPAYWKLRDQHPLTQFSGAPSPAHAISEFLSGEALHEREIYREFLLPQGVEDTMMVSVQVTPQSVLFFCWNRSPAQGCFTADDLALADLLRPHLIQAFANAYAFTESRALALLAGEMPIESAYGLLLLDAEGRLVHRNELAQEYLQRCFAERRVVVPQQLRNWIEQPTQPLALRRPLEKDLPEGGRICFHTAKTAAGGWLIALQEKKESGPAELMRRFALTTREAEVLHWLSHGKSNSEIALILQVRPRTVDKHMERILPKLGADSRAAAIVMVIG